MSEQTSDPLVDKLRRELKGVPRENRQWKALLLALDHWCEQENVRALSPGLKDRDRHYCAGGAQALRDFREFMVGVHAEANKT